MEVNLVEKPTLLWDGECGFCAHWIQRLEKTIGDAVVYRTWQEAISDFPQISETDCAKAVQLVFPGGRVVSAAHAVLYSLALGGRAEGLLARYERSATFRCFAETAYRFVAGNRAWLPRF